MAKEKMVAVFRSAAARLSPSTTTNMNKMAESPISQEPSEMEISFMRILFAASFLAEQTCRDRFVDRF